MSLKNTEIRYKLFLNGEFKGSYTLPQWRELNIWDVAGGYAYHVPGKNWYLMQWGSLVPLNYSDIPNYIRAHLLLIPIDQL
jgi:3',5'-cyclic AMP phosphodiesterase CpdA